jgi:hypothetical protein
MERIVHTWLHLPFPLIDGSPLGASIPGFATAFVVALVILPRRDAD